MKTKFLVKIFSLSIVFSGILFLFGGRLNYFQAWIFFGTNLITSLMTFWATRNNEELINERSKPGKGTKTWDKAILGLSGLSYLIFLGVSGLDSGRYQWSPDFHPAIQVLGILLTITGQSIFLKAKKENRYFSTVVRIQKERDHQVCDTGVYKIVRHPGYAGMMISLAALPLLTASLWGIIPVAIGMILLLIRTYLEDQTLKSELPGYIEYSSETKQRLFPKIW